MNLPIIIGGLAALFFLTKKSPSTSAKKEDSQNSNQNSTTNPQVGFYQIENPATYNKNYLLDQRGYFFTVNPYGRCNIQIVDDTKMYKFAFNLGKKVKEIDWQKQLFDGCDYLNQKLDAETMFYIYELYRYALSGRVVAKLLDKQQAINKINSFRNKIKNNGIPVFDFHTSLISNI